MFTRNELTSVECVIAIEVEGREVPSLEVVGKAVDAAIANVRASIKESYSEVPARV